MIFGLHTRPSQFRPTQKPSQSIPSLEQVIFGPHANNKSISIHTFQPSNFDPHTKTKLILTPTQKTSQFRSLHHNKFWPPHHNQVNFDPAHKKQVNFDPITEIKSVSIPTLILSRFRCPDTKTELILIQMLKTCHFRPPHQNQVNSDPYIEMKSISTNDTTTKSISSLHWNQTFSSIHHTEIKWPPTRKRSQFWCSH